MTVSSLANDTLWSPNYSAPRAYEVTRLTPHHTACVADAWTIARMFSSPSRQASCNYAIGNDGSIVCVVDEDARAWTSSSWDNDNRAITFEISDCDYDWNIGDAAIEAYINLCVDIIQRYPSLGGAYNYTGDFDGNVTFHNWFAATACPGPHLGSWELQSYIQSEVNSRLSGSKAIPVQLYESNGTLSQKWKPRNNGDGTISFEAMCSRGKFLDVKNGSAENGAVLQIHPDNGTASQKFALRQVEDEKYWPQSVRPFELVPALDKGLRVEVKHGNDASGAAIQLYEANGTLSQQWYVLDNGDTTWTLCSNLNRKLMLDVLNGGA